jgi:uncharacterized protein (DUF1015 family)
VATLRSFRALRPRPADAARIAAVPYDVVTTDEARALADGNPLSFLHVSRAEIEFPPGTDPHADEVYDRAAGNFAGLRTTTLVMEETPSLYLYRLTMGTHEQVGLAGCYSLDEYDRDVIRKHERTRRDKEDDRTRHLLALGAQTGPVFLTYRARADIDKVVASATRATPLIDFQAADDVRHTLWRVTDTERDALIRASDGIPALYIADGHHRAASAMRARAALRERGDAIAREADTFLAVAFPDNQVQILPYNRVVKDLGGLAIDDFLKAVRARFEIGPGPATPVRKHDIAMYVGGVWYTLTARRPAAAHGAAEITSALDVTVLQEDLLGPVLGIGDIRTDTRIEFVGGARGTRELERFVQSGSAAVAFSMYPIGVDDLMTVSDAGAIMPPKSTWFEPKLRDGLLIHVI